MCVEREIPLDAIEKLLPAVWKMMPQWPSAANDKKRYLPQSVQRHSWRGDLSLPTTNGEMVSLGPVNTATHAVKNAVVYHVEVIQFF